MDGKTADIVDEYWLRREFKMVGDNILSERLIVQRMRSYYNEQYDAQKLRNQLVAIHGNNVVNEHQFSNFGYLLTPSVKRKKEKHQVPSSQ